MTSWPWLLHCGWAHPSLVMDGQNPSPPLIRRLVSLQGPECPCTETGIKFQLLFFSFGITFIHCTALPGNLVCGTGIGSMHLSYTAHLKGLQDITSQLSFVGLTSEKDDI
ncbi:uncharacterized protein FPRO_06306 [Fusarium proliferatum ET1]|uniref:Uncharacterized protein n=1 Tax=Fusarium proliferatum (strain ET1) TaxID=1227346 RepID=A0A1L7VCT4_FUSPR|nr:uncharacterized protein FPRO_06306 [Fusarium proliferatum ET1]CZR38503.1 uncharacterized protein FPRO_06306 [Fusarium proliferatum ET1]